MICGTRTGQRKKQRKSEKRTAEKNTSNGILAKNKIAQPSDFTRFVSKHYKTYFSN